jgi:hypothetical protein
MFLDVSDEISTKVKKWAIILTVETVSFLVHMGYKFSFFINHSSYFLAYPSNFCFIFIPLQIVHNYEPMAHFLFLDQAVLLML